MIEDIMDISKNEAIAAAQAAHEANRPTVICGGCNKIMWQAGERVRVEMCRECKRKDGE